MPTAFKTDSCGNKPNSYWAKLLKAFHALCLLVPVHCLMCHATMQVLCSPESNGSDLCVKFVCQRQAISPFHLFKDCWKSSTSRKKHIQNLNQFFFTCIKNKVYYIYIALAFVGCLPLEFYHLWKKTHDLGGLPTSKPPKEARSAQP